MFHLHPFFQVEILRPIEAGIFHCVALLDRLEFLAIDRRDHALGIKMKNPAAREKGATEMHLHAFARSWVVKFGELLR